MKARAKHARKSVAQGRATGRGRAATLVAVASTTAILCAIAGVTLAQEAAKPGGSAATKRSTAAKGGYPSLPRIDFDGDFDGGCQLEGGAGGWPRSLIDSEGDGTGRIARTVVAQGKCSARLTSIGSSGRAELGRSKGGPDPHVIYEGLYRVPASTSHIGSFTQHKQSPPDSEDCFNGGLSNRHRRIELVTVGRCTDQSRGQRRFDLGKLPRGHWFGIKVELKFSNNPRIGYARAWIDRDGPGRKGYAVKLRRTGVDAESGNRNGARVKFRTGTYSGGRGTRTVYVDGWHMMCVTHC